MINRNVYLQSLQPSSGSSFIKLIAGIRYGGKSHLFKQLASELKQSGVDEDHIIHFDLDNPIFSGLHNDEQIENMVSEYAKKCEKYYIFLDEIQSISNWQNALNSLSQNKNFYFFVASSNAKLFFNKTLSTLSSTIKYEKIEVKTLSFCEYNRNVKTVKSVIIRGQGLLRCAISIRKAEAQKFQNYVLHGGFPSVVSEDKNEAKNLKLKEIYSSIIFRDVVQKNKVKHIDLLEHIIKYIFENIGCENSVKQIENYLLKHSYNKNLTLIGRYVKYLEEAFILKRVFCYNIETGKEMSSGVQYFASDHSLLNAVVKVGDDLKFGIFQNIMLNDLLRRNYKVWSGIFKNHLIDFVAMTHDKIIFVQLVYGKVVLPQQLNEKENTLFKLNELLPQYVDHKESAMYLIFINTDGFIPRSKNKIRHLRIQDFLLLEKI